MNKILSVAVLAAALVASSTMTACRRKKAEGPNLEAFPVRVQPAARKTLEDVLSVVGSLKAKDEAVLYSKVPGKLLEYPRKEGERVKKDETVALVERDEVGVEFKPAPVSSPFDGMVARTYLDRGAKVKDDTPLILVIDPSEILSRADVPERYAGRVSVGQSVRASVAAAPDRQFLGRVTKVSPAVDPQTRSFPIEAKLTDGLVLKSGMFADLTVILDRKENVLAVPVGSLVEEDGTTAVFVVVGGKAVRRPVETGLRTPEDAEIRSGVSVGEQVVTFGLFALKDGSPIDVLAAEGGAVPK